jgi:hypothetical protein
VSAYREFRPRNRIAEMIHQPGGLAIADALQRAQNNIEAMHGHVAASIDIALAMLQEKAALGAEAADEMYQLSNDIVGFAVTLELRDIGRAAYSLCELIERQRSRCSWSAQSVAVHVEALRLLREPGDAAGRAAILDGLDRVLAVTAR